MWNIGFGELAIICIVLIIAVGPERVPSRMKTVGKTVRTLRQASRDLRESTGIDELLREDFDYHPPPRRPAPPAAVAREEEPVMNPATAPMAAVSTPEAATEALPSDGPLTAATSSDAADVAAPAVAEPSAAADLVEHANVTGTLPSDAPLAAKAPSISAPPPAGPLSVPPPVNDDVKSRES
jgi:sec-independent protein translocase protein TatB